MSWRAGRRRVVADVVANMRMWWRSPTSVFFTIAFPLIFITIFGAIFGEDDQTYSLVVDDQDGSAASRALVVALWDTRAIETVNVSAVGDPAAYLRSYDEHSFMVIPAGYGRALALGNPVDVSLTSDPSRTQSATVAAIVRLVVQETNLQMAEERAAAVDGPPVAVVGVDRYGADGEPLEPGGETDAGNRYIDYLVPGVIGMTIATNALIGGLERLASLHETKVMRKIATTPIRRGDWVIGKALYQVFLGVISTIVIVVAALVLFDVRIRPDPAILVLVPAASVLFASLSMNMSRWVRRSDAANTAGSTVLFPQMFLTGVFFPLETMPGYLQVVAKLLPLTYVNDALRAAMVTGSTRTSLVDGGIVIVLALVGVWLASRAMDWRQD